MAAGTVSGKRIPDKAPTPDLKDRCETDLPASRRDAAEASGHLPLTEYRSADLSLPSKAEDVCSNIVDLIAGQM